jgi:hypothetical protein
VAANVPVTILYDLLRSMEHELHDPVVEEVEVRLAALDAELVDILKLTEGKLDRKLWATGIDPAAAIQKTRTTRGSIPDPVGPVVLRNNNNNREANKEAEKKRRGTYHDATWISRRRGSR